jgi:thiosulfate reductase cytochrome b subunit
MGAMKSEQESREQEDREREDREQDNLQLETDHERITRNFTELLQELRVTQTGVQILTGFLLTLPFTTRFPHIDSLQRYAYLAILTGSVVATGLIIAPVAFHRALFRRGERPWIVEAANRAARAGLLALALTTSGVVWLVFDLVTDRTVATVAGVVSVIFFSSLWGALPILSRRTSKV